VVAIVYSYFIVKGAEWLWQQVAAARWPELYRRHPRLFPLLPGLMPVRV
jgi:hypothetical protein